MNAIATFPRKELFAKITEPIQRSLRENLAKGTERELWEFLSRRSAGKFGVEIEIELKDIAQFLIKAFRTTYRALKALVAKGFCKITRTLSGYGYRVVLLVPKGCEVDQNCADTLPVLSHLGHSNTDSLVTCLKENLKEELTRNEEVRSSNSPLQKEGLRSPLPKPKPRNQDSESNQDPEPTTDALRLVAEYGASCKNPELASKKPIQHAISNIARNLSPEKLTERVRNAIAATEERRLIGGVRCLEALLSAAIVKGHTSNASKRVAAEAAAEPAKSEFVRWRDEVLICFPNAISSIEDRNKGRLVLRSDGSFLGTFEELRDLPIEEIGRLINPSKQKSVSATSDWVWRVNQSFPSSIREGDLQGVEAIYRRSDGSFLGTFEELRDLPIEEIGRLINPPAPSPQPTEEDLIAARALIPAYEEIRGIEKSARLTAIKSLIGATVSGLSRLSDIQMVQYFEALQKADPPE